MSLNIEMKSFSTSIRKVLNKAITKSLYEHLLSNSSDTPSQKSLSAFFCNNQGNFISSHSKCLCDNGMFGLHCESKGISTWCGWFTFFQVIFGIAYGIFSIIVWLSLIFKIKNEWTVNEHFKLFASPKCLVLLNLVIISTLRFFYLIIDPFRQKEITSHRSDNVLYYMIFGGYIAFYMQLFIVWMGMNSGMRKESKTCYSLLYNKIKMIFVFLMILIYPVLIIFVNFESVRIDENEKRNLMIFGGILFFMLLLTTMYLIFGLKKNISKSYLKGEIMLKKGIAMTKIVEEKNQDSKNKEFLANIIKSNLKDVLHEYIVSDEEHKNDFSEEIEYKLDYEKEIINFDVFQEEIHEFSPRPIEQIPIQGQQDEETRNPPTKNEEEIISWVFSMSYAFIGFSLLTVSLIISITCRAYEDEEGYLFMLFLVFAVELVSLLSIFILFFKEITLQEYRNLKIIGEFDKYLNPSGQEDKLPELVFGELTQSSVFNRFKQLMKNNK